MSASIDPSGGFATVHLANHSGSQKTYVLEGFNLNAKIILDGNTKTSIPVEINGNHALVLDGNGNVLAEVKIEEQENVERSEREIQQISSSEPGEQSVSQTRSFPSRIQGH